MKRALSLMLLTILACSGCNQGEAGKDGGGGAKVADSAAMQGTWTFVEVHEDGKVKEKEKTEGGKLEIAGDKMTLTPPGDKKPNVLTFKLDEAKKHIDLSMEKKEPNLGLYELKGDDLRIVFCENNDSKERSTKFETEPNGPNGVMFVLRRAK